MSIMEIRFDNFFYAAPAIKKAIREYNGLADFSCKEKNRCTVVTVGNIRERGLVSLFKQEFSNCVLSMMGVLK